MPKTKKPSERSMKIPAYDFYYEHRRFKVYKDYSAPDFYEFDGKCKLEWKAMSANEKAPFRKRSKDNYKAALESIKRKDYWWTGAPVDAGKAKKDAKKKKRVKDPNAPKRPMSALCRFSNDQRARLLKKHPGSRAADISIILERMFNLADCQTKKRYNELAEKDQQRYKSEMAEYKKKASSTGAPLPQSSKEGQESKRNSDDEESKTDSDEDDSEMDSDEDDSEMDTDEDDSEIDTDEEEPKMRSDEEDAEYTR